MACERKLEKYQELVEQCKVNKWRTACNPIEVGCLSFAGRSVRRFLSRLGMIEEKREMPSERFQNLQKKHRDGIWIKRAEPWSTTDK